jgi:hypothetical protein
MFLSWLRELVGYDLLVFAKKGTILRNFILENLNHFLETRILCRETTGAYLPTIGSLLPVDFPLHDIPASP